MLEMILLVKRFEFLTGQQNVWKYLFSNQMEYFLDFAFERLPWL